MCIRDRLREIANGGTTVDTTVILTGKATPNLKVVITDNGASPQTEDVRPDGSWTSTRTGLSQTVHSFVATASYGSGMASPAWGVNVTAAVAPTITSVKGSPSGVEIPNAGLTVETSVTLTGTASKGQKVEVFDLSLIHI